MPSDDAVRALYARLLAGDPTASSDIAVAYLDWLVVWLSRNNPRADPNDCETAAGDAILILIRNPGSYGPERQRLVVYLRLSALGDLRNLRRAEGRHARRRADFELVELPHAAGTYTRGANDDPATVVELREEPAAVERRLVPASVRDGLTPAEARVLELMRAGERRTAAYAAALGVSDLPFPEQRRAVKRAKNRLAKRVERAKDGTRG